MESSETSDLLYVLGQSLRSADVHKHMYMYMYCTSCLGSLVGKYYLECMCRGFKSHTKQTISLLKMTASGKLSCVRLHVHVYTCMPF